MQFFFPWTSEMLFWLVVQRAPIHPAEGPAGVTAGGPKPAVAVPRRGIKPAADRRSGLGFAMGVAIPSCSMLLLISASHIKLWFPIE